MGARRRLGNRERQRKLRGLATLEDSGRQGHACVGARAVSRRTPVRTWAERSPRSSLASLPPARLERIQTEIDELKNEVRELSLRADDLLRRVQEAKRDIQRSLDRVKANQVLIDATKLRSK